MNIRDYFLIGDLHTAALVSKEASIDWLCIPHFDSPSVFARILDPQAGHFSLAMPDATVDARYREAMAVVDFTVTHNDFAFELIDFMLPQPQENCKGHVLVRKLHGTQGAGAARFIFSPKPDYARQAEPIIEHTEHTLQLTTNEGDVVLHLPTAATVEAIDEGYAITIPLEAGEAQEMVLQHINTQTKTFYLPTDKERTTVAFWKEWVAGASFSPAYPKHMVRSMITLKLMQFYPSGALIAAPTTSLAADPGGVRNWDYRYAWIRDATFTVYAYYILDCGEEAVRFFTFVKERCVDDKFNVHLMYTITGQHAPREVTLPHLNGYQGAQPVRIGNDATQQFQLDVYGTLIDMHYLLYRKKFEGYALDKPFIMAMTKKIAEEWQRPDSGIWEIQNQEQHYTYSKVMAWVGIDRALRMKKELQLSTAEIETLEVLRTAISTWIWEHCYDEKRQVLVQHPKTDAVDATNFLFVLLQFLDKDDEKTKAIIAATEKELGINTTLVRRYRGDDGLPGSDHAFVLCSFWRIAAHAIMGNTPHAHELFEAFEKRMAEHGLLAEQIHETTGDYLGNYPQAFSHLGYVMSAYYLKRYGKKE